MTKPFPFPVPADGSSEALTGAYLLAAQKWHREDRAVSELREVELGKFPLSVIHSAQRQVAFAENELDNAVTLLWQTYREELRAQDSEAPTNHLRSA